MKITKLQWFYLAMVLNAAMLARIFTQISLFTISEYSNASSLETRMFGFNFLSQALGMAIGSFCFLRFKEKIKTRIVFFIWNIFSLLVFIGFLLVNGLWLKLMFIDLVEVNFGGLLFFSFAYVARNFKQKKLMESFVIPYSLGWLIAAIYNYFLLGGLIGKKLFSICIIILIIFNIIIAFNITDIDFNEEQQEEIKRNNISNKSLIAAFLICIFSGFIITFGNNSSSSLKLVVFSHIDPSMIFMIISMIICAHIIDKSYNYVAIAAAGSMLLPSVIYVYADGYNIIFNCILYTYLGFMTIFLTSIFLKYASISPKLLWLCPYGLIVPRLSSAVASSFQYYFYFDNNTITTINAILFVLTSATIIFWVIENFKISFRKINEDELIKNFLNSFGLTAKEQLVANMILSGKSNSEISIELNISEATARFHTSNLFKKMKVKKRQEVRNAYYLYLEKSRGEEDE